MAIEIYVGLPGSGKSLKIADEFFSLIKRNLKHYKKTGIQRVIWSNLKFSADIETKYFGFIQYWSDPSEIVKLRDVDILWDEIATHLDSTQWKEVPLELKRWLQQHRKYGIDIYGTTQDFPMIDISMRRLVSKVTLMRKLFGSRDKSATRPPVIRPWGLCLLRNVDPACFVEDKQEYKFRGFGFLGIGKKLCNAYDTTQEIKMGKYPPLKHIERHCVDPLCQFHKLIHI